MEDLDGLGSTSIAELLVAAEREARNPAMSDLVAGAAGHRAQIVYRHLSGRPDRADAVIATLPPEVADIARMNLAASSGLSGMITKPATELPDWRIRSPRPVDELLGYYRAAGAEFDVPWQYLAAIHLVETRMGRIVGLSSAGAQGPMQFMPATWDAFGEGDVNDDHDAIRGAANYLAASGAPDDMPKALWAYNHHDAYVQAVDAYARVMIADPAAYRGYWGWQVYYRTADGTVLLEEGWSADG